MTTNNHPAHGPVSLDRLHQIREILSKAAAQSDGGNLGYAMADAVKVIDGAIALFSAEPVGITDRNEIECLKRGEMANVMPPDYKGVDKGDEVYIYTAPPVPVLPNEMTMDEAVKILNVNFSLSNTGVTGYIAGYNACRAAMLQAGNHSEQHLDMVDHSGDTNKNVDPVSKPYKLSFDEWLSQQDGEIDVDCGCVMTEVLFHWMRVAYEAGNSPVTPDGWIPVSERVPDEYDFDIWVFSPSKGVQDGVQWDGDAFADDEYQYKLNDVTHWMKKLYPAAPQQEVKP